MSERASPTLDEGPLLPAGFTRTPADVVEASSILPPRSGRLARVQLVLALGVFAAIVLAAVIGDRIVPCDPAALSLAETFSSPSWAHWFGTDQIGRDQLSRVIAGGRVSLVVTTVSVLLSAAVGTAAGIAAGYFGGRLDTVIMRLADIQLALPAVILALVLAGVIGGGLVNLVVIMVMANWARFARVIRSETLTLRQRDFVTLAKLSGAGSPRIMARHLAPNVVGPLIVLATLDVGSVIILEATLSFLGLGIQPPTPSWGAMIADGRGYLDTAWWICVLPGLVLVVTVLCVNLLGDRLHDVLTPSMQDRW